MRCETFEDTQDRPTGYNSRVFSFHIANLSTSNLDNCQPTNLTGLVNLPLCLQTGGWSFKVNSDQLLEGLGSCVENKTQLRVCSKQGTRKKMKKRHWLLWNQFVYHCLATSTSTMQITKMVKVEWPIGHSTLTPGTFPSRSVGAASSVTAELEQHFGG